MTKVLTGEEALQEISCCLRAIDDIDDVAAIYTMIVREANVIEVEPSGGSAWVGYRLEMTE